MPIQAPSDPAERVLSVAVNVFGDRVAASGWLRLPIASFGDKTPLQLIDEGRADDIVSYLESIQAGYIG